MYLGSWKIDDVLTFTCNTHTPSTGAVTDADAVPTYRVYEDETGTPILTGSTAKLDDAGTTGFYSEQITLSAANGLEKGKTYTIRISGTVGGVAGAMSHTFQIEAEVDANIVSDKTGFSLAADQSAVTVGTVTLVTTTTTNTDMRGTDSAALAATALTDVTWTDAKAAFIDHSIATVDTNVDTLLTRITAARAGYLDNLSAGAVALAATALTDVTWTDAKAAFIDHSIATVDTNVDTLLTRVTAAVALASALATAQTDLDTITGADGVTLATAQALYAPNKVVPDVAGTASGLHTTTDGLVTTVDTVVDAILVDTGTTIPGTITTMQGNVTDILTDTGTTIPGTISTLQTDSTAIKANTDNLPSGIKKNTAYTAYTFLMVDSTDHVTAKTGLTVAGNYTGDGGAVAALTNTGAITEISNGLYEIDLTAGELNYNNIHLMFTASGADARVIGIHTST